MRGRKKQDRTIVLLKSVHGMPRPSGARSRSASSRCVDNTRDAPRESEQTRREQAAEEERDFPAKSTGNRRGECTGDGTIWI